MKHIIDINPLLALFLSAVSLASLAIIFCRHLDESIIAIPFYTLSFYTLSVLCYKSGKLIPAIRKLASNEIVQNQEIRQKYALTASVIFNGSYIALKSIVGLIFSIPWLVALALYYCIVFAAKIIILLSAKGGKNAMAFTGSFLIAMSLPLSFIARDLVKGSFSFHYPDYIIYAFALYSFVSLFFSVKGYIKTRKADDAGIRSYRTLSLALSAVTLLTLQSAMFSSFADADDVKFIRMMHIVLSAAVIAFVLFLGISLMLRQRKTGHMNDRQ